MPWGRHWPCSRPRHHKQPSVDSKHSCHHAAGSGLKPLCRVWPARALPGPGASTTESPLPALPAPTVPAHSPLGPRPAQTQFFPVLPISQRGRSRGKYLPRSLVFEQPELPMQSGTAGSSPAPALQCPGPMSTNNPRQRVRLGWVRSCPAQCSLPLPHQPAPCTWPLLPAMPNAKQVGTAVRDESPLPRPAQLSHATDTAAPPAWVP